VRGKKRKNKKRREEKKPVDKTIFSAASLRPVEQKGQGPAARRPTRKGGYLSFIPQVLHSATMSIDDRNLVVFKFVCHAFGLSVFFSLAVREKKTKQKEKTIDEKKKWKNRKKKKIKKTAERVGGRSVFWCRARKQRLGCRTTGRGGKK